MTEITLDLIAESDGVAVMFHDQLLAPASPWPFQASAKALQALGSIPDDADLKFMRDGRHVASYKLRGLLALPPPKTPDRRTPERRKPQARPVSS